MNRNQVNKEFIILTGRKGCGKTTLLHNLFGERDDAAGILTLTKEGRRILYDIAGREERAFEVDHFFEGAKQKIGKYTFDDASFKWAEGIIASADFSKMKYIVIDEAGPLELNRKGFYDLLIRIINTVKGTETTLVIVVREECVDGMIELLGIKGCSVMNRENFASHVEWN